MKNPHPGHNRGCPFQRSRGGNALTGEGEEKTLIPGRGMTAVSRFQGPLEKRRRIRRLSVFQFQCAK